MIKVFPFSNRHKFRLRIVRLKWLLNKSDRIDYSDLLHINTSILLRMIVIDSHWKTSSIWRKSVDQTSRHSFFDRIFRWDWDRSKTFPFAQLFSRLIKRKTKWRCSNELRFSSVVSYQRTDVELYSFLPESICQLNSRWKYPNDF